MSRKPGGLWSVLLLLLLLGGCSATVTRPPPPGRPTAVFLLDHGRTASLVLPRPEGLVRWAYGDWDWYARMRTGSGAAMRTLFVPSQGTLGRYRFDGPSTAANVDRRVRVPIQQLVEMQAEAALVEALNARLDGMFEQEREGAIYNASYQLEFVPHATPYTLGHNSNHAVADWLRELGCKVEGDPTLGKWRVRQADSGAP